MSILNVTDLSCSHWLMQSIENVFQCQFQMRMYLCPVFQIVDSSVIKKKSYVHVYQYL